jgi:hypothetical protein
MEIGRKLHERSMQGDKLTLNEQAVLTEWYATMDAAEDQLLSSGRRVTTEVDIAAVQKQIAEALAQLESFTRRIQQLSQENDDLRREVTVLRRQVAASSNIKQPA